LRAHEKYNETFDEGKHRESIYRELEKLVESGLVKKDYSQKEKRLVYNLQYCSAEIDFLTGTVEMIENADN
jgi:Fe2+ or Zn2+ uptake regulation protein